MSFNARIRFKKSKYTGLCSLGFEICENWRDDSKGGQPNHRTVEYIGTFKDYDLAAEPNRLKLWMRIDLAVKKLLKAGIITPNDAAKIEKRFDEVVPRSVKGFGFVPVLPLRKSSPRASH